MEKERLKEIAKQVLEYIFEELEAYGTQKERNEICKMWTCEKFDITNKEYDEIMGV